MLLKAGWGSKDEQKRTGHELDVLHVHDANIDARAGFRPASIRLPAGVGQCKRALLQQHAALGVHQRRLRGRQPAKGGSPDVHGVGTAASIDSC